jgi:hypothetical protein
MSKAPEFSKKRVIKTVNTRPPVDPVNAYISSLDEKVVAQENEAMHLAKSRWATVGESILKLGLGGASLSDVFYHNIHFWREDSPSGWGIAAGALLVVWGLSDAGSIPEKFRRYQERLHDSRLLRASLNRELGTAMESIPYKRLEQMNPELKDEAQKPLPNPNISSSDLK